MRSRNNGGVIGAYQLPNKNYANGVFFIHDAAIYNTGSNPIWPLASSLLYTVSTTGSVTIATANNNGNMKTATFTSNGTFTVNNGSGVLEVLLVGGGGPGGWANNSNYSGYASAGGGGGGGGVVLLSTWVNPGTTFTVEVGSTSTSTTLIQGYPSKISSTTGLNYTVLGGGYGGGVWGIGGSAGGSGGSGGGGGAYYSTSNVIQAYGTTGAGVGGTDFMNNGGSAASAYVSSDAGGGGGAGTVGYNSTYSSNTALASAGGDGYLWPRTGYYYGAGGGGGRTDSLGGSDYASLGGLSGTGIRTYGTGGVNTPSQSAYAKAGQNGYGQGGGGTSQAYPDTALPPGGGGSGTVIFCWRYQ